MSLALTCQTCFTSCLAKATQTYFTGIKLAYSHMVTVLLWLCSYIEHEGSSTVLPCYDWQSMPESTMHLNDVALNIEHRTMGTEHSVKHASQHKKNTHTRKWGGDHIRIRGSVSFWQWMTSFHPRCVASSTPMVMKSERKCLSGTMTSKQWKNYCSRRCVRQEFYGKVIIQ